MFKVNHVNIRAMCKFIQSSQYIHQKNVGDVVIMSLLLTLK